MREENNIPVFFMKGENAAGVYDTPEFHDNILELITSNLDGTCEETLLCHVIMEDGTKIVAELYPDAYHKSLSKSMEFFEREENYEKCKIVKELIERL